jgi:hypothetical protein
MEPQAVTGAGNATLYILVAGVAATAVWRIAGVLLSGGFSEESAIIAWVRAVSMALVAGLIARIVLFPPGALADISPSVRIVAFGLGLAAFFLARWNMGVGILAGTAALLAMALAGG